MSYIHVSIENIIRAKCVKSVFLLKISLTQPSVEKYLTTFNVIIDVIIYNKTTNLNSL